MLELAMHEGPGGPGCQPCAWGAEMGAWHGAAGRGTSPDHQPIRLRTPGGLCRNIKRVGERFFSPFGPSAGVVRTAKAQWLTQFSSVQRRVCDSECAECSSVRSSVTCAEGRHAATVTFQRCEASEVKQLITRSAPPPSLFELRRCCRYLSRGGKTGQGRSALSSTACRRTAQTSKGREVL